MNMYSSTRNNEQTLEIPSLHENFSHHVSPDDRNAKIPPLTFYPNHTKRHRLYNVQVFKDESRLRLPPTATQMSKEEWKLSAVPVYQFGVYEDSGSNGKKVHKEVKTEPN